jgi:hypothetical protein
MGSTIESVIDRLLLVAAIGFAAYLFIGKRDLQKEIEVRRLASDHTIDSLSRASKLYADSAKTWRELAKDCDLTVDSLNQVLLEIGKKKLQVKRDVESAPDSALIKMFYQNLYEDE